MSACIAHKLKKNPFNQLSQYLDVYIHTADIFITLYNSTSTPGSRKEE